MRPQVHEVGRQRPVRAEQRLQAHRARQVSRTQQPRQVGAGQHEHGQHAVGAVDQGQALLLGQLDRLQACLGQGGGCGLQAGRGAHLPLAHNGERDVRQRRQIPRAAQRAELPDHRRDAGVEQVRVRLGGTRTYAGVAGDQRPQSQQGSAADDLRLHLDTGARRVRAHEAALQLRPLGLRDVRGRQRPEPGRDAVRRGVTCRGLLDPGPGCREPVQARLVQADPRPVPRDRLHLGLPERLVRAQHDILGDRHDRIPPRPGRPAQQRRSIGRVGSGEARRACWLGRRRRGAPRARRTARGQWRVHRGPLVLQLHLV